MEIELKESTDCNSDKVHNLIINNEHCCRIASLWECSEDAIIGRDLIDGNDIISYIKMGYDAAKRGEELSIVYTHCQEED